MKSLRAGLFRLLCLCAVLFALVLLLQGPVAHRSPPFIPGYPMVELGPLLIQPSLSPEDYDLLFLQTGLGQSAVDWLLQSGPAGAARILETQEVFFYPPKEVCSPIFYPFVKEDHLEDAHGERAWAPPLADLQPGDILLTYSTHSMGWRHGHAGLVVGTEGGGTTLEAVLVGTDSAVTNAGHWRGYSNYIHLRLKDAAPELQQAVADYALLSLQGVPYRLTSGFFGLREPEEAGFGVQCSYLVWYAYQQFGYDLDSDGGKLVTVNDLAHAPQLEVVQIYGLDPNEWKSTT